jgi:hypothetical protein
MTPPWRPPGSDPAQFEALHDDIPPWMEVPFNTWMVAAVESSRMTIAREYDTLSRRVPPLHGSAAAGIASVRRALGATEVFEFVDYVVYRQSQRATPTELQSNRNLETILMQNGSAWRVGTRAGSVGLERRVPEGVQAAAEAAMTTTGTAGQLLSEAWRSTFGVSPDPSTAYSKAVKAVETAAIPVVLPANDRATLGTVIQTLNEQGDWKLPFTKEHADSPTNLLVVDMCRVLWSGQTDRHGANDSHPPTQAEAEAAVLLAVPLVQWFSNGSIARV